MKTVIESIFIDNNFKLNILNLPDQTDNFFAISEELRSKNEYYLVIFLKSVQNSELLKFANESLAQYYGSIKILEKFQKDMNKNTSLIICLEVDSLELSLETRNSIYEIEEAPFYFKRYVISYTALQVEKLLAEIGSANSKYKSITTFLRSYLNQGSMFRKFKLNQIEETGYNLVSKLFIKLPFLTLDILKNNKLSNLSEKIKTEIAELEAESLVVKLLSLDINDITDDEFLKELEVKK